MENGTLSYLQQNITHFDAALIRLSNPVQFVNNGKYYEKNMICLPSNNTNWINKYEYVFLTGWGRGHNDHLQTGAFLLVKDLYTQRPNIRFFLQTINDGSISCYVSAIPSNILFKFFFQRVILVVLFGNTLMVEL